MDRLYASWSWQETDSAAASGTDSYVHTGSGSQNSSTAYGGSSSGGLGTSSALATVNGTFQNGTSATDTASGTDSSLLTERGTYGQFSFSLTSVVYRDVGSADETYHLTGSSSFNGTVASTETYTGTDNSAGVLGGSSSAGLGAVTQVSQGTVHQAGDDSQTLDDVSSSSFSLYEAGTFSQGSYGFSSVNYSDGNFDSWTSRDSQSATASGTDSVTLRGTYSAYHTLSGGGAALAGLGTTNVVRTDRDAFQHDATDSSTALGSSTDSLTEQGTYGNQSYAFACYVYREGAGQSLSAFHSATDSATDTATDSESLAGNENAANSYGVASFTGLGSETAQDNATFTQGGSSQLSLSLDASSSYSLYQDGCFALGSYSLGSVNYRTGDQESFTLGRTDFASDAGTYSSSAYALVSWGASRSYAGSYSYGGRSLTSQTANGTSGDQSRDTLSATGTGSSSLTELGCYAAGSYAFTSVVFRSGQNVSGNQRSSAQSSYNDTSTGSSTAGGSTTRAAGNGCLVNGGSSGGSDTATWLANSSGTDSFSSTDTVGSLHSEYAGGCYAFGSYAFASVNLFAQESHCSTYQEFATETDVTAATDSALASQTSTDTLGFDGVLAANDSATYSHTANSRDTQTAISTVTGSTLDSWTDSEQGSYANGSYAFTSVVYRALTAADEHDDLLVVGSSTASGTDGAFESNLVGGTVTLDNAANVFLRQSAFLRSALDSFNSSGGDTVTVSSEQAGTTTLYEAGSYSAGSYSLSSVSQVQTAQSWYDLEDDRQQTQDDNLQATLSTANGGSDTRTITGPHQSQDGDTGYQSGQQTLHATSQATLLLSGVAASTLSVLGTYNGTDFSFSSVVYRQHQESTQTLDTLATDSFSAAATDCATMTTASAFTYTSPGFSWLGQQSLNAVQTGSHNQSGQDTVDSAEVSTESDTLYEAGSYSLGSYAFTSVTYNALTTDEATATHLSSSSSAGTTNSSNASGTAGSRSDGGGGATHAVASASFASISANGTFNNNAVETELLSASSNSSVSEQGTYGGGSFAFSSVIFDEHQESTATHLAVQTNQTTQTVNLTNNSSASTSDIAGQGNRSGNSSTGYSSTGSQQLSGAHNRYAVSTEVATDSSTLYQAGSYGGGSYAFSSVTYDRASSDRFSSLETAIDVSGATNSASVSNGPPTGVTTFSFGSGQPAVSDASVGTATGGSSTSSVTSIETTLSTLTSSAGYTLHEAGVLSNGCYSLTSVVYDSASSNSFTINDYASQTSVHGKSNSGTQDVAYTALSASASNNGSTGGSAGGNGTATALATRLVTGGFTATAHEEGTFAGGSFALSNVHFTEEAGSRVSYTSFSQQTSTNGSSGGGKFGVGGAALFSGTSGSSGGALASDSLACYVYAWLSYHEQGTYGGGSFALSEFELSADSLLTATDTIGSIGSATLAGTVSGNGGFSGHELDTFNQTTAQNQSSTLDELGSYASGSFALSNVDFNLAGTQVFSYAKDSASSWTGDSSGADTYHLAASGNGSFAAGAAGSYPNGGWDLSTFTFDGRSSSIYTMSDTGWLAGKVPTDGSGNQSAASLPTTSYLHTDNWNESDRYHEEGTYHGAWSFASYNSTQATEELITDSVTMGTVTTYAAFYITDTITVTGSGTTGTQVETGYVSFTYNGGTHSFPLSGTSTVTLTGPALAALQPEVGTLPQLRPGGLPARADQRLGQAGPAQVAMAAPLQGLADGGAAAAAGAGAVAGLGAQAWATGGGGLAALPYLGAVTTGGNIWLTPQGPNRNLGPWQWCGEQQDNFWQVAGKSYRDGWQKALTSHGLNPLALGSKAAWATALAGLPDGVSVSQDWMATLQDVSNAVWGFLDGLTFGLSAKVRGGIDWLVGQLGAGGEDWVAAILRPDMESSAYQWGHATGTVLSLAITILFPGTAVARVLQLMGTASAALDAGQAALQGDWRNALKSAALAVSFGLPALGKGFCALPWALKLSAGAILIGGAGVSLMEARAHFANGEPVQGLQSLVEAALDIVTILGACFTGDMLLDVEGGKKRADAIVEGDRLWSRPESEPQGALQLKEVEEVFVRVAPVWNVHVAGQILRTTGEHPFYVEGKGWVPAAFLREGDLLRTRDRELVPVEGVADSGEVTTVYNWQIAEYHTYYVSATQDGNSLWAHNAGRTCKTKGKDKQGNSTSTTGGWVRPKGWRLPKNGTWEGTPGDSNFIPNKPAELGLKPGEVVPFRNGRPDFSKWSKGNFTSREALTGEWNPDAPKMIKTLAEQNGWTHQQVKDWLTKERLSLHHAGGNDFQLIPWELHGNPSALPPIPGIRHMGGAFELRNW